LELGFTASLVDPSLFIYHHGTVKLFMLIYVDDILLTGTNSTAISSLISHLLTEFHLKDLGSLGFLLGIQATYTSSGLHLCQAKYISDLLHRANMLGAKPLKSPCPLGSKLSKFDGFSTT
jgi:hypothetical protein